MYVIWDLKSHRLYFGTTYYQSLNTELNKQTGCCEDQYIVPSTAHLNEPHLKDLFNV